MAEVINQSVSDGEIITEYSDGVIIYTDMHVTKEKRIKCNHPEFGFVIFREPSIRQEDILKLYNKIENLVHQCPNDAVLGAEVRKLFT